MVGEKTLEARLYPRLRGDELLTADRNFYSFEAWSSAVRAVVVDEVHAFAGDDRGWHLLAVLERIARLVGRPLQRVGLSATVGNPDRLLAWLQASGGADRRATGCQVPARPGWRHLPGPGNGLHRESRCASLAACRCMPTS